MAEYVRLGQVSSKVSEVVPSQAFGIVDANPDAIMGDTDSRVPLLSSADTPEEPRYGLRASDEYGTSGNKSLVGNTIFDTNSDEDDDDISEHADGAHGGVHTADAINRVWSRNALIMAYVL